ncbi:phage replisome organizer N-terminal domain-containing protein [Clostridium botulinum]|uniref:phage replisome organizer N-terminal domain-containing protein n=1 Tax=Clostridium botulinum TaxID=1491 RepID=UPI000AE2A5E9|nr:phage replisome organizer N-terminal domain-containing protein [Clostridium botulinum]
MIIIAKKYYWLKLKEDFFRQKEIKKLRKIAGGDTYTIIYLKMMLLSLKDEGKLFFEGLEDSFIDEIALEIDEDLENVKVTIMFLIKCRLIEELTENEFLMTKAYESIGSETQSAERVRRFRQRKKALLGNSEVTKSNTEIDIEKEREIDIEKDKIKINWNKILEAWNALPEPIKSVRSITDKRKKKIKIRMKNLKLTEEDILKAIDKISKSNFCNGVNKKGWTIEFDWLFKDDNNITKVLEDKYINKDGKYGDRENNPKDKSQYDFNRPYTGPSYSDQEIDF